MLKSTVNLDCKKETGHKMGMYVSILLHFRMSQRSSLYKKGKDERATPLTSLFA